MKKAWEDLKSFVTIAMIVLLFIIVIANIFGKQLDEKILIVVTNLITSIFTYYFTKKENKESEVNKNESIHE